MTEPSAWKIYLLATLTLILAACGGAPLPASGTSAAQDELVVYSGRSESLVGPIVEQFEDTTGIPVSVRWGNTPEVAATLLEEGNNSPADVFFAQDPGGLGAVLELLTTLPDDLLAQVDPRFLDPEGHWVGVSGRARVVVYNTGAVEEGELPEDLWGYTEPEWNGRIGWAPSNGSFQTMVTAMRVLWGEREAEEWVVAIQANGARNYENNTSIVAAVGAGEIDVGFVNHYYLYRFLQEEGESFPARNHYLADGGPGSLVMVAGAGVLESSNNKEAAFRFLDFLLSTVAQQYFASQTYEYPLVAGIQLPRGLTPLEALAAPQIGLAGLSDLQGTVQLLQRAGALP